MALLISDQNFPDRKGARDTPQSMALGAPRYLVWTLQVHDVDLRFILSPDAFLLLKVIRCCEMRSNTVKAS
jgi:hypothetical protein